MFALLHRALALAVVLVAATTLTLAEGVGVVSGRVTDERGEPLKNVAVTLTSPGVLGTMRATTNPEGRYWFPAVPGNHPLTVRADAAGRVPVEYVGHTARRNGSTSIDFRLRSPGEYEILVLMEDGIPYHQSALDGALSTMPGHTSLLLVDDAGPANAKALRQRIEDRPSAVLAIGDRAARLARRHVRDVPIVYSLVPAPHDADLTTANVCGVPLNGGFATQIEHLLHVMPEARRIGTMFNPHRMGRPVRELTEAATSVGLELVAAHVHSGRDADIPAILDNLRQEDLDAFILLLDPRFINTESFRQIIDFTESEDLMLVVPDPSLAVPERSFAFVPGFWELGAYSGTLVRRIVEGSVQPSQIGMTYPDKEFLALGSVRLQRQTPGEVLPGEGSDRPVQLALEE